MIKIRLQELNKRITKMIKDNPEYAELPLMYSTDDEGNDYHSITNFPYPAQVGNTEEWSLDMTGFKGEDDIEDKNVNIICIN